MPVATTDAFRRITVQPDNVTIVAEQVGDTLTLVAGSGISLVANTASDQITIVNTNSAQFSLGVAGDDSSIKTISSGETIRFAGTSNVTVTTDSEGKITITGPDLSSYLTASSKIGYGSGSTVTQASNRGNGVTINALSGTIVLVSDTISAGDLDTFYVFNNQVDPTTDIVYLQVVSYHTGQYLPIAVPRSTPGNGFHVFWRNIDSFATPTETVTIRFFVFKAPNA